MRPPKSPGRPVDMMIGPVGGCKPLRLGNSWRAYDYFSGCDLTAYGQGLTEARFYSVCPTTSSSRIIDISSWLLMTWQ